MKTCGDCSVCCQGILSFEIDGSKVNKNNPCRHLCDEGCSIYKDRPKHPCQNYSCIWLNSDGFPDWMRPDKSKVLMTMRDLQLKDKIIYYIECLLMDDYVDSKVWESLMGIHTKLGYDLIIADTNKNISVYGDEKLKEVISNHFDKYNIMC